jgi:putative oxidoreductase
MISKKISMFGPLPIRIQAGITFIAHGLPKFQDVAGTQGFFGNIGLPPELALPIGLLEVIGGIFLLVGVVTRITAALFIIDMIGATLLVKISKGFVGGYELELLLMALCIKSAINWTRKNIYRVGCIEKGNISKRKGYCSAAKGCKLVFEIITVLLRNQIIRRMKISQEEYKILLKSLILCSITIRRTINSISVYLLPTGIL